MSLEQWLVAPADAPPTWDGFPWPEWVPADVRPMIEKFWDVKNGRGPQAWFRDNVVQQMPFTGERITTEDIWSRARDDAGNKPQVTGRYIHAWNNIGRLLLDDGRVLCVSPSWRSGARHQSVPSGGEADRG